MKAKGRVTGQAAGGGHKGTRDTRRPGRWVPGALLLLLMLGALTSCPQQQGGNPASLWLSYAQVETNVVLVDYEPPPF